MEYAEIDIQTTGFFHRTPEEIVEVMKPWRVIATQEITSSPGTSALMDPARDPMHRFRILGVFAENQTTP